MYAGLQFGAVGLPASVPGICYYSCPLYASGIDFSADMDVFSCSGVAGSLPFLRSAPFRLNPLFYAALPQTGGVRAMPSQGPQLLGGSHGLRTKFAEMPRQAQDMAAALAIVTNYFVRTMHRSPLDAFLEASDKVLEGRAVSADGREYRRDDFERIVLDILSERVGPERIRTTVDVSRWVGNPCGKGRYAEVAGILNKAIKGGKTTWIKLRSAMGRPDREFGEILGGMRNIPLARIAAVAREIGWKARDLRIVVRRCDVRTSRSLRDRLSRGLGAQLKRLRREKGIRQEDAERKAGLAKNYLQNVEGGQRTSSDKLEALLELYRVGPARADALREQFAIVSGEPLKETQHPYKGLGRVLARLRGEMTRSDMARGLGIGFTKYAEIEQGRRPFPADRVARLAEFSGRSVDEIATVASFYRRRHPRGHASRPFLPVACRVCEGLIFSDLSSERAAHWIGMDGESFARVVRGEDNIPLAMLDSFARVLKIGRDDLEQAVREANG